MPLHDWAALPGWDGVHQVWIVELLYWIKPRLPEGFRAYIGTTPTFAIGAPGEERPDVEVRDWHTENSSTQPENSSNPTEEPDQEAPAGNRTELDLRLARVDASEVGMTPRRLGVPRR